MSTPSFVDHDHGTCIADALAAAEASCRENRLQLTPVRRRVLEILLKEHRALGAYDILDQLRQDGLGNQPPQVYRALDFLIAHGFAHKVEQKNAYISCSHPTANHSPAFLICTECDVVAEVQADLADGAIEQAAVAHGFVINTAVIEVRGTCPKCLGTAS